MVGLNNTLNYYEHLAKVTNHSISISLTLPKEASGNGTLPFPANATAADIIEYDKSNPLPPWGTYADKLYTSLRVFLFWNYIEIILNRKRLNWRSANL